MPKQLIHRDPRLFEAAPPPGGPCKLAVGLDLATTTGVAYAWFRPGAPYEPGRWPIFLGQWDLSAEAFESGALRFAKLRSFLSRLDPDAIFYERVRNTPAMGELKGPPSVAAIAARITPAAQLVGGLMATVACWAEQYDVPCLGVGIADIKRRATGRGNADKSAVIAACNREFGTAFPTDDYEATGYDNVADAAYCLALGLESLADGVDPAPRPARRKAAAEPGG